MNEEIEKMKTEDYLRECKRAVKDMKERFEFGTLIEKHEYEDGQIACVKKIGENRYGYAVYEKEGKEPYYYAEGNTLLKDLDKKTDSNGVALRYPGPKSMIQRNMTGIFAEYIDEKGFEGFYINIKFDKDSEFSVAQRMAGYNFQDPVVLLGSQFFNNRFYFATDLEIIMFEDKPTLRFGTGALDENGDIDFEQLETFLKQAELAKRAFGENYLNDKGLHEKTVKAYNDCGAVLYPIYSTLGLPLPSGVEYNPLLTRIINGEKGIAEEMRQTMISEAPYTGAIEDGNKPAAK